jgi:hypothetical protein
MAGPDSLLSSNATGHRWMARRSHGARLSPLKAEPRRGFDALEQDAAPRSARTAVARVVEHDDEGSRKDVQNSYFLEWAEPNVAQTTRPSACPSPRRPSASPDGARRSTHRRQRTLLATALAPVRAALLVSASPPWPSETPLLSPSVTTPGGREEHARPESPSARSSDLAGPERGGDLRRYGPPVLKAHGTSGHCAHVFR